MLNEHTVYVSYFFKLQSGLNAEETKPKTVLEAE